MFTPNFNMLRHYGLGFVLRNRLFSGQPFLLPSTSPGCILALRSGFIKRHANSQNSILMKKHLSIMVPAALLVLSVASAADSSSKDSIKQAVKQLGEKSNYAWTTSIEWGGNVAGTVEGRAQKDGPVLLKMERGDQSMEAVLKGEKGAVKTDEGWKTLAEASGEGQENRVRMTARILQNYKAPVAEAEDLISKAKDLKTADGVYSSDLTDEGAKELMRFGRRAGGGPEVKSAKGSVKLWVKDGLLSKYEFSLEGTMNFNGEDRDVSRKHTVEIKDVGTAKVNVPAEAEKKLSS
jgi:hypothetical protein